VLRKRACLGNGPGNLAKCSSRSSWLAVIRSPSTEHSSQFELWTMPATSRRFLMTWRPPASKAVEANGRARRDRHRSLSSRPVTSSLDLLLMR